ncbi:DinB family protein [Saccharospirillum salsuginis]|uniref:DinB family protein n=1 Tax=Saccharospirillum salsuginis TaxID=418750 RepID=UPI0016792BFA|nr:DinB family protein [Saccharospirillum salsuginis]
MTSQTGLQRHLAAMTHFHHLAYERLFGVLETLTDEQYRGEQALFFGSIHGTVNHLHLVDCLWHWRIQGVKPEFWVTGLDMEVEADRNPLFQRTLQRSESFRRLVASMSEADLLTNISARTMSGGTIERPGHLMVMTVVNHGTHHRGQICAALTRMGIEYPPLDIPFFEELVQH